MLEDIKNDLDNGALRLLSEYREFLLHYAKTLVSSKEDAEDLVFCTIERVLAKADTYDKSKGDLLTWMKTIMVNLHRDGHRRKLSDAVTYCPTEEMGDIADDTTNETILRNSDSEYIRQVVATLPSELREVIVLQYFAEQPIAKVAKILAIPPGTVASRVHLAKKILVKKLATEFGKAKKPLAVLGVFLIGAMTLFGAYQTGLVDVVKSYFTTETPAMQNGEVSGETTSNSVPTSKVVNVEPITTFENDENTEIKGEEPMKLTKTIKSAAMALATTIGVVGSTLADGETYLLTVNAGEAGQVQVTANGVKGVADSLIELSLTNGSPVVIEYIPNVAGDWRYLSGSPAGAKVLSPTSVSFVMPAEACEVTAVPFAYSDDYVFSTDATVVQKKPYEGRIVYVFTNTASSALLYARVPLYYEESLVVAGGGSGSISWGTAGGGGGVLRDASVGVFEQGSAFVVTVGSGGTNGRGGSSVLAMPSASITTIGGGRGGESYETVTQDAQMSGGSGGGGNMYTAPGLGTEGQGFAGGAFNSSVDNKGGGGGGAEAPGGSPAQGLNGAPHVGGNGGDGRWDAITGELHCYGSGGGGSLGKSGAEPGMGGAESGGRGGVLSVPDPNPQEWTTAGMNGVDGLGGGGGGAVSGSVWTRSRGGNGTVIVAFSTADMTGKRFACEPFDTYPLFAGVAEPTPEIAADGITLEKGTDYELEYENNDRSGTIAYMVIVGKNDFAGQVIRMPFRPASVHYVTPDGTGDGSDWAHAMSIVDAVNGLANGTYEIWCKAGEYDLSGVSAGLTIPCETVIRGGFAADDLIDVAKRDATEEKTIFDGADKSTLFFDMGFNVNSGFFNLKQVVFEDCVFQRSTKMCVRSNSKATPLVFTRCLFRNNVVRGNDSIGTCVHAYNCGSAPLTFKECRFEGNLFLQGGSSSKAQVYGHVVNLTMEGCSLITNGVPYDKQTSGWDETRDLGSDICVWCHGGGTANIRNCDFRGNFLNCKYGSYMAIVRLEGPVNGTIEHCRFVGNSLWGPTFDGKTSLGILNLLPNNNIKQTVRNCTFAFNTVDKGADGCSVIWSGGQANGIVSVENCIFWGNADNEKNKNCRDLQASVANMSVKYSLFEDLTQGACANLELDDTNLAGDPKFEAAKSVEAFIKPGLEAGRAALNPEMIGEILELNVHLKHSSVAVNRGNPASDWSKEPKPNGKRINMGCYGGTDKATCTPPGMAVRVR